MTREARSEPRLFYGWYIVGAGFLTQFVMGVLLFHSFGTYVALMQNDFGWSRTTFSIAFAVQRVESGVLGPIQGWVIDTYGPRRVMLVGMVMFAAGFFTLSQVDSLWTFYLAFLLLAIGASLGSFLAIVVSLVNWFRKRRTLALSMLSLGFAVGGLTAAPVALLIEAVGWRTAAFSSGIIVLLVGIPLALVVRHRPEPYGLLPDGASSTSSFADDPEGEGEWGMTAREALRSPSFWFISLGQASALLVIGALMVHLVVFIHEDLGYGLGLAAFAITVQTVGQIGGQVAGAYFGDRFPKRPLIVLALFGHAFAMLLLALASGLPMIYAAVAINGTAWGFRSPLQMAIRADYFGAKQFGTIMGFSSLVIMLGMIVGPTFAGVMYDQTGSYRVSFFVLSILAALGSILFVFAKPPEGRERWLAAAAARSRRPAPTADGAAPQPALEPAAAATSAVGRDIRSR